MPRKAVEATCVQCGKVFLTRHAGRQKSGKQFCSGDCWQAYRKSVLPMVDNICPICGKVTRVRKAEFEYYGGHRCCSMDCGWIRERRRKLLVCKHCGKEYEEVQSSRQKHYCSWECFLNDIRNRVTVKCDNCGKDVVKGRAASERAKHLFCSTECARQFLSGENSPSWKGGITKPLRQLRGKPAYRKWREAVFERDNFTCQKCGKRGGYLHPHHIRPFAKYPEGRFDINNGVTLCEVCHGKEHGIRFTPCSKAV
jgi:endogenous inhibitor of DNA gyrase (YacG/DUF329 family)